ncbi:SDR family oxidoreductase [Cryobacterium algoricola]|uniref:SDR family oxidoreductase n=1 Tax=Cryobacterium algoricola TaxID=1259183 RepID=A0ABY2ICS2_9MICO|nr:SDR family oxidoreductase [Cryobacterium algoricola]TFB85257.1 SDR family oxidoreductase [Cryobacterium algoricola]
MRIFITGASGWIGSAVSQELIAAGHEVVGLARNDESFAKLQAAGVTPHRGSLDDLDSMREAASAADGVIHLAYKHDFSDMAGAGATERATIEMFGDTLAGSDRPFLFASGVAGLAPDRLASEDDAVPFSGPEAPRGGAEALALSYADRGIRSVALRFAPTVHGEGDHGFMQVISGVAGEKGVSGYVGDGSSRWPAVNRRDAARMVALALAKAPAGSRVHAVGEEGISSLEIAAAIGDARGLPLVSIPPEDAAAHFGWIGIFFGLDVPTSSARTQDLLGWTPTHAGLVADIQSGFYGSSQPDR